MLTIPRKNNGRTMAVSIARLACFSKKIFSISAYRGKQKSEVIMRAYPFSYFFMAYNLTIFPFYHPKSIYPESHDFCDFYLLFSEKHLFTPLFTSKLLSIAILSGHGKYFSFIRLYIHRSFQCCNTGIQTKVFPLCQ